MTNRNIPSNPLVWDGLWAEVEHQIQEIDWYASRKIDLARTAPKGDAWSVLLADDLRELREAIDAARKAEMRPVETSRDEGYQARVYDWMKVCFQRPDAMLPAQRAFRFVEEALELAQASGTSREDVLRLVAYTFGRPPGVIDQELGGVMVTLAALATSFGLSLDYAAEAELKRCHENTEKIRAKDLAKPQRSPLPGSPEEPTPELYTQEALDAAHQRTRERLATLKVDTDLPVKASEDPRMGEVRALVQAYRKRGVLSSTDKVSAVRLYRAIHGCSLKEAVFACDAL